MGPPFAARVGLLEEADERGRGALADLRLCVYAAPAMRGLASLPISVVGVIDLLSVGGVLSAGRLQALAGPGRAGA